MSKEKEEMKPLTEKDKNFALYLDFFKLKPTTCMNIYLQHNKIVKRALQEERMKWQSAIALLKKRNSERKEIIDKLSKISLSYKTGYLTAMQDSRNDIDGCFSNFKSRRQRNDI